MSYLELCDCGTFLVAHTARRPTLSGARSARNLKARFGRDLAESRNQSEQMLSKKLNTIREKRSKSSIFSSNGSGSSDDRYPTTLRYKLTSNLAKQ
ncbi:hypothetical protein PGT21_013860 [Puccinia graminis f. sp. tritici]|uniref:Uncharacterized protein n=1 Tax=Puccinia graminis f. sp. tritici TaxID=56615 RepID=A0A5B0MHA7_PUCGR|nr:hypothetical protein PGT21_013860 [Puccinia graminis f. sp. tritici]KAA1126802.1 hypothetical protein PGTUg99_021806 [Puccinia graminis f. sp. tritici]